MTHSFTPANVCPIVYSVRSSQTTAENCNPFCITLNPLIRLPSLFSSMALITISQCSVYFLKMYLISPTLDYKQHEGRVFVHCVQFHISGSRAASDTREVLNKGLLTE